MLVAKVKQPERGDRADETQHRGDPKNQAHVPRFGLVPVGDIVVGDGQDRAVVEQRQHDDHDRCQGVEVEDDDRQRHEQKNAQRLGDAVDRVAVHPLKNLPALLDRIDDHRQPRRHQHD